MWGIADQSKFAGLNTTCLSAHVLLAPWVTTSVTWVTSLAFISRPHGDYSMGVPAFPVTAVEPCRSLCCHNRLVLENPHAHLCLRFLKSHSFPGLALDSLSSQPLPINSIGHCLGGHLPQCWGSGGVACVGSRRPGCLGPGPPSLRVF